MRGGRQLLQPGEQRDVGARDHRVRIVHAVDDVGRRGCQQRDDCGIYGYALRRELPKALRPPLHRRLQEVCHLHVTRMCERVDQGEAAKKNKQSDRTPHQNWHWPQHPLGGNGSTRIQSNGEGSAKLHKR